MISFKNPDDSEYFKWCLVRSLNPADYNQRRITKPDKDLTKKLGFKDIKFRLKVRDILKIETKNFIDIGILGYENKVKYLIYVSKTVVKINMLIYY